MSASILLGAIALVAFLLVYLMVKLDEGLYPVKILLLFFFFGSLLLMGKVTLDNNDYCSWNVANSTVSGSTTTYEYERECATNEHTTAFTFYNGLTWFVRIISILLFVFFIYKVLEYFGFIVPKGGGGDGS